MGSLLYFESVQSASFRYIFSVATKCLCRQVRQNRTEGLQRRYFYDIYVLMSIHSCSFIEKKTLPTYLCPLSLCSEPHLEQPNRRETPWTLISRVLVLYEYHIRTQSISLPVLLVLVHRSTEREKKIKPVLRGFE